MNYLLDFQSQQIAHDDSKSPSFASNWTCYSTTSWSFC